MITGACTNIHTHFQNVSKEKFKKHIRILSKLHLKGTIFLLVLVNSLNLSQIQVAIQRPKNLPLFTSLFMLREGCDAYICS
jgi:hypothetical protein